MPAVLIEYGILYRTTYLLTYLLSLPPVPYATTQLTAHQPCAAWQVRNNYMYYYVKI